MHKQEPDPAIRRAAPWNFDPVPHVRRIVAVASGKGGVGKSTTTVNLAHALAAQGLRVGILDADIYGPSIPRMLGLSGRPEIENNLMLPLEAHGIKAMSMQFITGDEAAVLRGPMISKALHQLLRLTRWGDDKHPLDLLLVDMPPGTGDIHLSLAQQVPLDGAVIVTTPQEVALMDARKAAGMFEKLRVKRIGVIENMSGGMFGSGGGARLAQELGAPLLAVIGLEQALCETADAGQRYAGAALAQYRQAAASLLS